MPLVPQAAHEPFNGSRVTSGFLDGDDIEPGDDLGKAGDGVPVSLRRVLGAGQPFAREVAQGADIPCPDQQVGISPGGDRGVEGCLKPEQIFGYCCRWLLSHDSMQADSGKDASRRTGLEILILSMLSMG